MLKRFLLAVSSIIIGMSLPASVGASQASGDVIGLNPDSGKTLIVDPGKHLPNN